VIWKLPLSLASIRRVTGFLTFGAVATALLLGVGIYALPASDPQPRCAVLFASALSSPDHAVAGSSKCQTPELQLRAGAAGYDGDAGIQQFAKDQGLAGAHFIGVTGDGGYVYRLQGADADQVLIVWLDQYGHVWAFQRLGEP